MNTDIEYTISTRGRTCWGRWYPRPDRISIFLNKIAEVIDVEATPELFIGFMCAVEFHELGHIYGWRGGCSPASRCNEGMCFWCNLIIPITEMLME